MNKKKFFAILRKVVNNPPQLVNVVPSPTPAHIKLRGRFAFLEGK